MTEHPRTTQLIGDLHRDNKRLRAALGGLVKAVDAYNHYILTGCRTAFSERERYERILDIAKAALEKSISTPTPETPKNDA